MQQASQSGGRSKEGSRSQEDQPSSPGKGLAPRLAAVKVPTWRQRAVNKIVDTLLQSAIINMRKSQSKNSLAGECSSADSTTVKFMPIAMAPPSPILEQGCKGEAAAGDGCARTTWEEDVHAGA
jgi:hypothetical protein